MISFTLRERLPQLLFALTLLAAASCARADDVPSLRPGLWEYQRAADGHKFAAKECIDPSEDLRREHAAWTKRGCKLAPTQRSGTTYTYAADCAFKVSGGAVTFSTLSVLNAESDSAYRIENRMTSQGKTTSELITAQRVGDCTN